jgi:hypothetical protein
VGVAGGGVIKKKGAGQVCQRLSLKNRLEFTPVYFFW